MYKSFIKRIIDIVISLIGLIVLSPLFLIIAILIKLDSKGDVFDAFKSLHPALANLNPEDMANQGNSAPMHPAAEAYFKEKGWLK